MKVHAGRCKRKDYHIAEKIVGTSGEEGTAEHRFRVRWKDYCNGDDTWEPFGNLPPTMIKEYLLANNQYDHEWTGARCPLCDKKCKNERGVKNHMRFCYHSQHDSQQNFKGTNKNVTIHTI